MENIELTAKYKEKLFFPLVELLVKSVENKEQEDEKVIFTSVTYVLYCLRFLYSLPTRRFYFRRVFPPSLYSSLVDIKIITNNFQAFQNIASEYLRMNVRILVITLYGKDKDLENFRNSFVNLKEEIKSKLHSSVVLRRIADYDLIEEIGQGAYGKVYLAEKNQKKYAVKIVKIESSREYEKNSKEIEILSRVS